MKRTISFMTGKGSVNHNSRKFHAKNTDPERSCLNVEYCNENVKDVYHELFDEALAQYNEKQTRSDRRIDDYYEKIRFGKQEKPFHEIILQIGDKDNMGAKTENGQLAEQGKKLKEKVTRQEQQISRLTDKVMEQSDTIDRLQEKAVDLGRLERYFSREQVQSIVERSKALERAEKVNKHPKRAFEMSR